ncbi:MAG TPA: xylulokinase [Ignavibacteria bacterium]|nr:xylulokinase [Ignavibacteria bacterium]
MSYFIGLDVGTSGAKALLINEKGEVISSATNEYQMLTPKPNWTEQNPEEWWEASKKSIQSVASKVKKNEIKGIGLTGQMHGLVTLDENMHIVRPCIMWNDQRTVKECDEITAKIGFDKLIKITGNQVLTGFTAPKILWIKNNEPENYKKIRKILLPKDYIRFRLTGELATDVSDASGTSLLNVPERKWSDEILTGLEISKEWMPQLYESSEISGRVKKELCEELNLPGDLLVVAGGGDQAAGGVGTGTVKEGITSLVLGTSGVVFAHSNKPRIEANGKVHSFCHAVPDAWHVMGVTLSAAGSLQWYRNTFHKGVEYSELTKTAEDIQPGSEGLFFLPYLSGERTPYADANAKGTFIGATVRHNSAHFTRAVLEGVAYSLRDCFELNEKLGVKTEQVRISGGGAKNNMWIQILSDLLNKEIVTLSSTEGASYGAAILAAVASGEFNSVNEACNSMIKIKSTTTPNKENINIYEDFYNIYKNLYGTLKSTFVNISGTVEKYSN